MNLQCAPVVLDQHEASTAATTEMLRIIDVIAAVHDVALFRSFEIMRFWHVDRGIPFDQMISNFDGNWLHQNDWSYDCWLRHCAEPWQRRPSRREPLSQRLVSGLVVDAVPSGHREIEGLLDGRQSIFYLRPVSIIRKLHAAGSMELLSQTGK
jgi:hypothetical protein